MPCGGSPWQNIYRLRKGGKERVEAHVALFHQIWGSFNSLFKRVAIECLNYGGKIAMEWPTGCAYWR
eukprot:13801359-Heterocapsa_arctica.AAC.1